MGYIDGANLYEYIWSMPSNGIDELGLWKDNGDGTVTVEAGDNLSKIAREATGDEKNNEGLTPETDRGSRDLVWEGDKVKMSPEFQKKMEEYEKQKKDKEGRASSKTDTETGAKPDSSGAAKPPSPTKEEPKKDEKPAEDPNKAKEETKPQDAKGGAVGGGGDWEKYVTDENVQRLAQILADETGGKYYSTQAERDAVAQTVMNRMRRNNKTNVSDVAGQYANTGQPVDPVHTATAQQVLSGQTPDSTGGATHFYSPVSMPKEGDPRTGDTAGGLEQTPGLSRRNYRPGWATKFEPCSVPGVRISRYKLYQATGKGPVR